LLLQISRLDAVLKELYEEESFESGKHCKRKSSWTFQNHQVPSVEYGESPFAVLRLAFLFDGTGFVEKIENFDISLKFDSISTISRDKPHKNKY